MIACDVLVVGGGPAGSSCARALRDRGLDAVVLDRARFPRDKVCAGWITPQILETLAVDADDYRKERVLQPIRGFRVCRVGDREVAADCGEVVSYGIRRCEFDAYLLAQSGAPRMLGEPLRELRHQGGHWIANDAIRARALVGAGGHFCPVARRLGATPGPREPTVVAREIELETTPEQHADCAVHPELPELFFAADLRGYGWVVRKGDWLNVGLGRQDSAAFPRHVESFLTFLAERGRIPRDLCGAQGLRGHAYLLYDEAPRPLGGEGALLVGDAAGLAYGRSGEGIRPAVESGLLAARVIADANARVDASAIGRYERLLRERFGVRRGRMRPGPTDYLPARWRGRVAGRILAERWFAKKVVVERWFLRRHVRALVA